MWPTFVRCSLDTAQSANVDRRTERGVLEQRAAMVESRATSHARPWWVRAVTAALTVALLSTPHLATGQETTPDVISGNATGVGPVNTTVEEPENATQGLEGAEGSPNTTGPVTPEPAPQQNDDDYFGTVRSF